MRDTNIVPCVEPFTSVQSPDRMQAPGVRDYHQTRNRRPRPLTTPKLGDPWSTMGDATYRGYERSFRS